LPDPPDDGDPTNAVIATSSSPSQRGRASCIVTGLPESKSWKSCCCSSPLSVQSFGYLIGNPKGYGVLGAVLGFFLGIIGWIIVAVIPAKK
jgi:hypothetical protein